MPRYNTKKRFPIGVGFAAGSLDEQIIIWGGFQSQDNNDNFLRLPINNVYSLKVSRSRLENDPRSSSGDGLTASWTWMKATGAIHNGYIYMASAVCEGKLYIHGGKCFDKPKDTLSTLSSTGVFTRLQPTGDIPAPRSGHRAFSNQGKFYSVGGLVPKDYIEESRKADFVESETDMNGYYYNNDLHQYDPVSNSFSRLLTTGARFQPRIDFGIATLGNRVYVHGGFSNEGKLIDFLMLDMSDMKLLTWTKIQNFGFTGGMDEHTLSPISATQLFLVGGVSSHGVISNKVRIFDVDTYEWKDEAPLPAEFGGNGGGLKDHNAVELQDGNGTMVICLGGYMDKSGKTHPNHIGVFGAAGLNAPVKRSDVKPDMNLLASDVATG